MGAKTIIEKRKREELKRLEPKGGAENGESIEENFEENLEEEQGQQYRMDKKDNERNTLERIEETVTKEIKNNQDSKKKSAIEAGIER